MPVMRLLDGNEAGAYAAKLARVGVIGVYPITPQTEMVTRLARMVAEGELKAKYITAESEHAAMSICAGASAAGARVFTASASQGIVYMEEVLWAVAGQRLPVVMAICNRTIAFAGNVRATHNDSLLQRDNGWIQLYCENSQEVLDTILQAYRIAENRDVYLPVAVCLDAFSLTHTAMPVEIPDQKDVDTFLPPYKHEYVHLDPDMPQEIVYGPEPDDVTEYAYQREVAMQHAKKVVREVDEDYHRHFGRSYGGPLEEYRCEGAEGVLITMGSITGTAKDVVDEMRRRGQLIGLVKLRAFRPFPSEEMRAIASRVKAVGFVDRNFSLGSSGGGVGCVETARALYPMEKRPLLLDFIIGLEGRDVTPDQVEQMANRVLSAARTGRVERDVEWVQLRS